MITVLGIDPGLSCTGWGIIRVQPSVGHEAGQDFQARHVPGQDFQARHEACQTHRVQHVPCQPSLSKESKLYTFVDCGILKTDTRDSLCDRLAFIYDSVYKLIKTNKPDKISIERVFVNINPASSEKLIMARTTAILAIAKTGNKYVEFAPNMIKKIVTGMGHSSKELVKECVWKLLQADTKSAGLDGHDTGCAERMSDISICHFPKTADASDALAIALCAVMVDGDNCNGK